MSQVLEIHGKVYQSLIFHISTLDVHIYELKLNLLKRWKGLEEVFKLTVYRSTSLFEL